MSEVDEVQKLLQELEDSMLKLSEIERSVEKTKMDLLSPEQRQQWEDIDEELGPQAKLLAELVKSLKEKVKKAMLETDPAVEKITTGMLIISKKQMADNVDTDAIIKLAPTFPFLQAYIKPGKQYADVRMKDTR